MLGQGPVQMLRGILVVMLLADGGVFGTAGGNVDFKNHGVSAMPVDGNEEEVADTKLVRLPQTTPIFAPLIPRQ
jgi:hypothetical protein